MLSNPWVRLALAGGVVFAAYKWAPNPIIKSAAVSLGAVIAAKQIPIVKEYV
jgi:hypothetical protein